MEYDSYFFINLIISKHLCYAYLFVATGFSENSRVCASLCVVRLLLCITIRASAGFIVRALFYTMAARLSSAVPID